VVESTSSILRREPWIEVLEEHIRLPDGRLVDDFYTVRLRDFVVVAPFTQDGLVVLVRHYRHGPRGMTYSLPSGFIDPGESPAEAAKRELVEETGYVAGTWTDLGSFVVDGNRGCGTEHVFMAAGARREREAKSHDLAETTVELASLDDAVRRVWRGEVAEMPSAAAIALAVMKLETEKSTPGA
jgi:ADP-ribose diphosphatase